MSNRRSKQQIIEDRRRIVIWLGEPEQKQTLRWTGWVRPPAWASASDIAALVADGTLEQDVRVEYDKQPGTYANNLFGGAGVVQRRRRYVRPVPTA